MITNKIIKIEVVKIKNVFDTTHVINLWGDNFPLNDIKSVWLSNNGIYCFSLRDINEVKSYHNTKHYVSK